MTTFHADAIQACERGRADLVALAADLQTAVSSGNTSDVPSLVDRVSIVIPALIESCGRLQTMASNAKRMSPREPDRLAMELRHIGRELEWLGWDEDDACEWSESIDRWRRSIDVWNCSFLELLQYVRDECSTI